MFALRTVPVHADDVGREDAGAMAKNLLLLHIGPDQVDVSSMTETLALARITVPDVEADAFARAAIEIRRTHKAAGLKRKQVEGAWAQVCRRAFKTKGDCFVSVPGFFDATTEQAALALDSLVGLKVVLVVTSGFDVEAPAAWLSLVKDGPHARAPLAALRRAARRPGGADRAHRGGGAAGPAARPDRQASQAGQPATGRLGPAGPRNLPAQCGCQASSSSVRAATPWGSVPSARSWMVTCSKTIRSELRAAIHTCWRTLADSSYSTASGRRP